MRLDYPDIRNQIRNGDILLFRGKSLISRVIGWITGSPYSHAGVLAWWHGRLMVLEAVASGVVASRMSIVAQQYSGKIEVWTTDAELARSKVLRAAQRLLGKRYSTFKLLQNLGRLLFGRRRDEAGDPDDSPEDFVCSEFVSRVWRAGGIDLVADSPDRFTKPSDIAKSPCLRKIGNVVVARPDAIARRQLASPAEAR